MSPGPWSVASHGYPGLAGIHSLKWMITYKQIHNLRLLTVVTTLSHGLCAYVGTISLRNKDAV